MNVSVDALRVCLTDYIRLDYIALVNDVPIFGKLRDCITMHYNVETAALNNLEGS